MQSIDKDVLQKQINYSIIIDVTFVLSCPLPPFSLLLSLALSILLLPLLLFHISSASGSYRFAHMRFSIKHTHTHTVEAIYPPSSLKKNKMESHELYATYKYNCKYTQCAECIRVSSWHTHTRTHPHTNIHRYFSFLDRGTKSQIVYSVRRRYTV